MRHQFGVVCSSRATQKWIPSIRLVRSVGRPRNCFDATQLFLFVARATGAADLGSASRNYEPN